MQFKRAFITATVVILGTFFVTVLIAMNSFNSQIKYSNERNIIEQQVYYNAYAGLQKGIFLIRENPSVSTDDYFSVEDSHLEISPIESQNYTHLRITMDSNGVYNNYIIESTGYGKFKQGIIKQTIKATVQLNTEEKKGVLRLDTIEIL